MQRDAADAAERHAAAAEAELKEARQQASAAGTELQAMEEAFTELQAKVGGRAQSNHISMLSSPW